MVFHNSFLDKLFQYQTQLKLVLIISYPDEPTTSLPLEQTSYPGEFCGGVLTGNCANALFKNKTESESELYSFVQYIVQFLLEKKIRDQIESSYSILQW